jgi:signal transduction histidine kinase
MKRFRIVILICCWLPSAVFAQPDTDSLRAILLRVHDEKAGSTQRIAAVYALCGTIMSTDSLRIYLQLADSLALASKLRIDKDMSNYARAYYHIRRNEADSALRLIEPLIPYYAKQQDRQPLYLGMLFFKAKVLDRANRYTSALQQLYQVDQVAASMNDTLVQIQAKTGIGWVQMELEQFAEALKWLQQALHFSNNKKYYKNYGALYSNLASAYNAVGRHDSAQYFIEIAIKDARESYNQLFLATALSMQAKIFTDAGEPALAEAPLNEVVAIRRLLNDPFYTVYDMSSLASYYARNGQSHKGIELCKEGIVLAKKSGLTSQLLMIYRALAENYKAAGEIAAYSQTLESVITLKDSFNNINSSKLLADMQANTEALKNANTITEQKLKLTVQNYWLLATIVFSLMAGVIVWLLFRDYRRKQKLEMEAALADEKRIAAQSVIDAEEQERRRISADLHDNIGAYATAICADVENISLDGLDKSGFYLENLQKHSQEIINSLRDTIWVLNRNEVTVKGISERMKDYIFKLRPSYAKVQFHIESGVETDSRLSSAAALNIFRIVQESLHNALKHSGARNIYLRIASSEHIEVEVRDDGLGMSDAGNSGGNGLRNMQARAAESGMKLTITHPPEGGVSILLVADAGCAQIQN